MLSRPGNALPLERTQGALPAQGGPPAAGLLEDLSSAFDAARAAFSNFLELIALEARRAGLALVWMVACGLVSALCIAVAWLGLMAAFALWAVSLGFPPIASVIAIAAINLAAGAGLIKVCIRMSHALLFSAVRRQVAGQSPVQPPAP